MRQISWTHPYGRTLDTVSLKPSQIRPPWRLMRRASAQSSMTAPRIAHGMDYRVGDCRVVLSDIADDSIPLILTDPPYGTERVYNALRWPMPLPSTTPPVR